jgi:hypothetical protein
VARQRSRTAQEYEEELRRHELLLARSLVQAVGEGDPVRTKPAVISRALNQAIRDLRALRRDLDAELHPPAEPPPAPEPPPQRGRPGRGQGQGLGRRGPAPGQSRRPTRPEPAPAKPVQRPRLGAKQVLAYEAAGNEIDEVLERWERRLEQLPAPPSRGRQGGQAPQRGGAVQRGNERAAGGRRPERGGGGGGGSAGGGGRGGAKRGGAGGTGGRGGASGGEASSAS